MALTDPREGLVAPNAANYTIPNLQNFKAAPPSTIAMPAPLKFDPAGAQQAIQDNINSLRAFTPTEAVNPYQMGKQKLYGAGLNHHQFERYYEHPKFNTLGFSPFRDNEAFYNKNSSWFDDFQRASGEWATLTGLGFKDALGFGDLTDTENAKKYEKAMAIGSSTRGGVAGFTNNLFLNSGYTFGILAEMAVEEIGLALATAATLGTASPLTGPAMALRATRAFSKINQGLNASKNILKAMDNLSDINKARQYFTASMKNVGNFINPLEQGTDFLRNMNKLDGLSNLKKVSTGVGAFYRDVRNARLVYGESSLEGGFVQNQMEEELLNDHYLKYDRPPTDDEAKAIKQTALKAGTSTSLWNMPVIFMSNKLVFDNMFKTFNPVRRLTQGTITQNMAGEVIQGAAKKSPFEIVEANVKGRFKSALNVRNYPGRLFTYSKANFAEGIQESLQEVITGTTHDYYVDQYSGGSRGGVYSYIGNNIKKQFSGEGAEIFLSGFLMGGLVQGPQKVISKGFNIAQAGGIKGYREQKAAQKEQLVSTVNTLNDMYNDPAKYFAPDLENLVDQEKYQKGMSEASKKDDPKMYHDLKDASVYQHITTALRLGKMDTFYQRLDEMKNLSPEEFTDAFPGFGQDANTVGAIDKVIARAKNIEKRYKTFESSFPNPFNPSQHKYGTEEYKETMLNKIGHDQAVQQAVFLQDSFDRTLSRMTSIQSEIKGDAALEKVLTSDFNAIFTIADTQNEITQLKREISVFNDVTVSDPQARKYKSEKEAKLKALEDFSEAMDAFQQVEGKAQDSNLSAVDQVEIAKERTKSVNTLYKQYTKYLRTLAKTTDEHVFDVNLEKSFQKLLDFYALNEQSNKLTVAVNTLTDPKGFTRVRARISEALNFHHANRKANIQVALEKYNQLKDTNELLAKLYDANMFFDPDQMDALLKDGKLPTNFFYADGPNKLDEVDETSADYDKALAIVSDFVEVIMGRSIREARPSPYDFHQRVKFAGDKRTYGDYATQYGFDAKADESKVPLKQVLQAVVNSDFVTIRERALAKRLLLLARDGETVTFSKTMATAGEYNPTVQTKVDARYSARDFKGTGIPLEVNILRQEIHRQASSGLKDDALFKGDIQKLYEAVTAFYAQQTKDTELGGQLGLSSLENFISEAMLNPRFQLLMAAVPYAAQAKQSTWSEFVNSVQRLLKRFFGKNSTNTALNAAVDIITTKFDSRPEGETVRKSDKVDIPGVQPTPVEVTSVTEAPITANMIFDIINDDTPAAVTLKQTILTGYKKRNQDLFERDETPLDINWLKKTDAEILSSKAFKAYATTSAFTPVREGLKAYNLATGRTAPVTAKTTMVQIPVIITSTMKTTLGTLGYSADDIYNMTPAEAQTIITGNLQKKAEVVVPVIDRSTIEKKRSDLSSRVSNMTADNLGQVWNEILTIITDSKVLKEYQLPTEPTPAATAEWINEMFETKRADLAFEVDFDKLAVGDEVTVVITPKEGSSYDVQMLIDSKTTVDIMLHKVGDENFTRKINKNQVATEIRYAKYNTLMEETNIPQPAVTQEEENMVAADFKTAQTLTDEDSLKEDREKALTMTKTEAQNELLNNIEEC